MQGATQAGLQRIRSAVGACAFGPPGGASLTLRFIASGVQELDPVFDLSLRPLQAWATAIWEGRPWILRRMAVAFSAALKQMSDGVELEKLAPGPARVTLAALTRVGWVAEDYRTWVTDRGTRLALWTTCPRSVHVLGRLAVERWQWRHVATQYPGEFDGFDKGGDAKPLFRILGKRSPLTAPQRQLVHCAFIRRFWPAHRRAAEGYQDSSLCEACGEEVGTIRHALYRCPAVALDRHHADLGPVGSCGARSAAEHHLFTRGVMPDMRHRAPLPNHSREIHWDPTAKSELISGHAFLDGSRFQGEDPLLARAGWGVAAVRVVGECLARAWGPFPGIIQCIDAAEVYAAIMAMRLGIPPHTPIQ